MRELTYYISVLIDSVRRNDVNRMERLALSLSGEVRWRKKQKQLYVSEMYDLREIVLKLLERHPGVAWEAAVFVTAWYGVLYIRGEKDQMEMIVQAMVDSTDK